MPEMMPNYEIVMSVRWFLTIGLGMFALGLAGWPAVWRICFPCERELLAARQFLAETRDELADSQATVERLEDHAHRLICDPKYYARCRGKALIDSELTYSQRVDLSA